MPLDSNLLYMEMFGSALIHAAIPATIVAFIGTNRVLETRTKLWIILIGIFLLSFAVQSGFLASLQANSCGGVKTYGPIFKGGAIGGLISAVMAAIPLFVEPLRLIVSQLFMDHHALLTPQMKEINNVITQAATNFAGVGSAASLHTEESVATKNTLPPTLSENNQSGGGALTQEQYEDQTMQEIRYGASYWTAFAGAYGVAVGSMIAANQCK